MAKQTNNPQADLPYYSKRILTMDEAVWYTGLERGTLRNMTSSKAIKHFKPTAKLVYFLREDLDAWMLQNPVKTAFEIEQEALMHTIKNRR